MHHSFACAAIQIPGCLTFFRKMTLLIQLTNNNPGSFVVQLQAFLSHSGCPLSGLLISSRFLQAVTTVSKASTENGFLLWMQISWHIDAATYSVWTLSSFAFPLSFFTLHNCLRKMLLHEWIIRKRTAQLHVITFHVWAKCHLFLWLNRLTEFAVLDPVLVLGI